MVQLRETCNFHFGVVSLLSEVNASFVGRFVSRGKENEKDIRRNWQDVANLRIPISILNSGELLRQTMYNQVDCKIDLQ